MTDDTINGWKRPLRLMKALENLYLSEPGAVVPPSQLVFRALQQTAPEDTRVVLVGQDPYPQEGKAVGLSFAVPSWWQGERPDSLTNICKEVGCEPKELLLWPKRGVLMLNAALTTRLQEPRAHLRFWKPFTQHFLNQVKGRRVVFLLLGKDAQEFVWSLYGKPFTNLLQGSFPLGDGNWAVCTGHPSPLSASGKFLGSGVFQDVNRILINELKKEPIQWTVSK